jgi:chitinase
MIVPRVHQMSLLAAIALAAACGTATTDAGQGVEVQVQPPSVGLAPGGAQTFAASVTGSANTAVTWSLQPANGGTITAAGLYTAPGSAGTYTVVATSAADTGVSAAATVTVTGTPPPVSVTVNPPSVSLGAGGTAQFAATVSGSADQTVTWSVVEAGGGSITAGGLYTAPATANTYHVKAVPAANTATSATAAVVVSTTGGGTSGMFVTGYWASWTAGNMVSYPYTKIDWTALTHLNVAFAYPQTGGALAYQGGNLSAALAKSITAAAHANGKKAILMVGGVGSSATFASVTGETAASAQAFAQKIVAFAQADGFDGVDLDWEAIIQNGNGGIGDGARMKNLALALRALWPNMVLTVAMGWDATSQSMWTGMKDAGGNWLFDQFNVMNYDAANGWPQWVSWFHNAFDDAASNRPSSVVKSLTELSGVGVPKNRIGMGLPFYGSAWLKSAGSGAYYPRQTIAQNYNAATQGADTTYTYKYILDNFVKAYDGPNPADAAGRTVPNGTNVGYIFDAKAGTPYITGGTAGWTGIKGSASAITFLSFEDPTSIATKGAWAKANGYGGAIIWLINEGATDANGTNPLLSAVKAAFLQ